MWVHEDDLIVYLTVGDERLETTPEHPFYVEGKGWVPAGDLEAGDRIRQAAGEYGAVQAIVFAHRPQVMYNLTVDQAHTFFVGEQQLRVHNACGKAGFGSGIPVHTAEATVLSSGCEILAEGAFCSGGITAKEAALGFPYSTRPTHTEARVVRQYPLRRGETMIYDY